MGKPAPERRLSERRLSAAIRLLAIGLIITLPPLPAMAEEDPIFGFVPAGGRSLLASLLEAGAPDQDIAAMLQTSRDAAGWLDWLQGSGAATAGLAALDDWELQTLAAYLANVAPTTAQGLAGDALRTALPRDGRDMIMRHCQSCHIITVTVTQDRPREAWLGTLRNPSHVEIALSASDHSEIADYLVLNAAIPIDRIPRELRAGGASY